MPSSFNWVDFAEDDQRRIREILYLFREREIREELGLGTIRDAIADILFPGTSTLHTRAKYLLFVPWIFLKLESKEVSSANISQEIRKEELNLSKALLDAGETDGVIGRLAGDELKILPSYMYWTALGTYGIRRFEGPTVQYFRYLDRYYEDKKRRDYSRYHSEETGEVRPNWDPNIVPAPDGFPDGSQMSLTQAQALYLKDRIVTSCHGSLMAFLLQHELPVEAAAIWEHSHFSDFPAEHQNTVQHARNFSEIMNGAALLYNQVLSEAKNVEEWVEKYIQELRDWSRIIKGRKAFFDQWNLTEFWELVYKQNPRIPLRTKRFVEKWIGLVLREFFLENIYQNQIARALIKKREVEVKGKNARMRNRQMLEKWMGQSGVGLMTFRWTYTRRILKDILNELEG